MKSVKYDRFKYAYMFMLIIYAAQPTYAVSGLLFPSDSIIGFIFPIIMTAILLIRKPINFINKNFIIVLIILSVWFVIQINDKGSINTTLSLYHYYQLFLCFIVIQTYKLDLFPLYEDIVYKLTIVGLVFWGISLILPTVVASFMHLFNNGTTISEGSILIYTMMDLDRVKVLIRNAGFAWEPGRYSCFLCLAIYCNLLINKFSIKNKRLWIFILALFTTQSTTGLFTLFVLMLCYVVNQRVKWIYFLLFLPIAIWIYSLDFVGEKMMNSYERGIEIMDRNVKGSLDRFDCFVVDLNNFIQDPVIGFCERRHSATYRLFEENSFPSGLMQIFAQYGIFIGLLYFFCLWKSSKCIAIIFHDRMKITFLLLFVFISMSYNFTNVVLVMSFVFWRAFLPPKYLQSLNYSLLNESIYSSKGTLSKWDGGNK